MSADRNTKPLKLLLVEDSKDDADLLLLRLEHGGYDVSSLCVETAAAMRAALQRQPWDLVISDYVMPQFTGLTALKVLQEHGTDIPFIIVSGHIGEVTAVAAMKAGAHDYLMKDNLTRLIPAVERELAEAKIRQERREAAEALRQAHDQLEQRVKERTADLATALEQLRNAVQARKRLEQELLDITERERRRIGVELHDDLGQRLTGIAFMLKSLELNLKKKKVEEAASAAKIHSTFSEAMNHAKDVARHLTSLNVQEETLPNSLKRLAAQVRSMFKIRCSFRCSGRIPKPPENTVQQLYKIAQEAVTNAIRHAKSKRVDLKLSCASGKVILAIRNDGLPFPSIKDQHPGVGLRIMNYRANLIDATLEVKSARGGGTTVLCAVPIHADTE